MDPTLGNIEPGLKAAALAQPEGRIRRFEYAGKTYWVKRPEKLSSRLRVQKGNPARSFERERRTLAALHSLGAPVPPILGEGPEFLILPDRGMPVVRWLRKHASESDTAQICNAAGQALARLHGLGATHGRPRLRDILWDGARITFIDTEAGARIGASRTRMALDLVLFVHSFCSDVPDASAELHAAIAGYRANDPCRVWDAATTLTRWARPLIRLTAPIARNHLARGRKSSEVIGLAKLSNIFR